MKRNATIARLLGLLAVALFFGAEANTAFSTPPASSFYSGGAIEVQKTGSGCAWVVSGPYKNTIDTPFCDFVAAKKEGSTTCDGMTIQGIKIEIWDDSQEKFESHDFKFDDNADGDIFDDTAGYDSGEDNTTDDDGTYSGTGRSISGEYDAATGGFGASADCIPKNGVFKVSVKVCSDESCTIQWQATGAGSGPKTGHHYDGGYGGPQIGVGKAPKKSDDSGTSVLYNDYGLTEIIIPFENDDGAEKIESVDLSAVSPVTISSAAGYNGTGGSWNSGTGVFTFSPKLAPGETGAVKVTVSALGTGTSTVVSWTANFVP
jgi:hypothetical protein